MTTWFTADLHLGHANIIRYCDRPFESAEEMDAEICRRWASVVGEEDTVWVLGDVCLGDVQQGLGRVEELPGTKRLILGNHDRPWVGNRMSPEKRALWVARYLTVFDSVTSVRAEPVRLGGHRVRLSHFPRDRDPRFRVELDDWRPRDTGEWLLHGHLHGALGPVHGKQIDVGVDCWDFTPVAEAQILEILEERE